MCASHWLREAFKKKKLRILWHWAKRWVGTCFKTQFLLKKKLWHISKVGGCQTQMSQFHIFISFSFFLHISTFMEKRGQWKWNFFCWTPPLDFMEIELDNTEDKLCFKTLLNIMLKFLLVILRDKLLLKMRFHIQLFNQWEHWEIWRWPTTCFMKLALQLSLLYMC